MDGPPLLFEKDGKNGKIFNYVAPGTHSRLFLRAYIAGLRLEKKRKGKKKIVFVAAAVMI